MTGFEVLAENRGMGPAVRLVRQVQIAMLVSTALYVVAGEMLARTPAHDPANALFHALSFISISIVGATLVVRRTLVLPSEALLKETPDDTLAVARWRTGYLVLYALCEALGVFGLILRMAGFTLANVRVSILAASCCSCCILRERRGRKSADLYSRTY